MASKRLLLHLSRPKTAATYTPTRTTPSAIIARARSTLVHPRRSQPQRPSTTITTTTLSSLSAHPSTPTRAPYSTSVEPPDYLNAAERHVFDLLNSSLSPSRLEVQDISGGCGSMYGIEVVSEQFRGLSTIKQHRLVNKVLGEEIKKWHGVQLKTKVPE